MKASPDHPRKNVVLCISGMAGCGKSTVAKKIAEKYKLHYLSGGDALKALALEAGYRPKENGWWESEEGMKFLEMRTKNPFFDRQVDQKLLNWAKQGSVVLDSWTMPWLLKTGFKVWLEASSEERAKRIAQRDRINIERARTVLKKKDTITVAIYKKLYGFNLGEDFSPFDLILDVNHLNQKEVCRTLSLVIESLCANMQNSASHL